MKEARNLAEATLPSEHGFSAARDKVDEASAVLCTMNVGDCVRGIVSLCLPEAAGFPWSWGAW